MSQFTFKIIHHDKTTLARVGEIHTPHGVIETPAFVPVGTQATVKSLTPEELESLGVQLFFVNTYHAYLRPGMDVINKFNGLHRFMNWNKPVITDSGGFQVFSLGTKKLVNIALSESAVLDREKFTKKLSRKDAARENIFPDDYRPVGELVKIDEDGVTFTSHWDGSQHRFTPEVSMQLQWKLGSDIHIAFDECTTYPTTEKYALSAMERTHRWAVRSLEEHKRLKSSKLEVRSIQKKTTTNYELPTTIYQALYGVVQGSVYKNLREQSADFISKLDFDGIAIGGVSVGETKQEMKNVCEWVIPRLPDEKPRHLLGVGEIDDIFMAVENGIDTFDCVQPTRLARMGYLYSKQSAVGSSQQTIDINKKEFSQDVSPIDQNCICYTCRHFSKAYIHHLFRVRELLAYRLATIHNLHFVLGLVKDIRKSLLKGNYLQFKQEFLTIKQ